MQKPLFSYICGLVLVWLTGSCVEPYLPPPIEAPEGLLVIDGYLNSGIGESQIRLSRTQNLADTSVVKAEVSASVFFEGDKGSKYPLTEKGNGLYTLESIQLENSEKYRLKINTSNGQEYESEYVAVKATPPIDSVSWKVENGGLQLYANTHDEQNNTWYYRWRFEETWQYTSAFESTMDFVNRQLVPRSEDIYRCWRTEPSTNIIIGSSTRLTRDVIQEFPLQFLPSDSEKLGIRYSILVRQYALSKESYEYLQKLEKNTENLGTLFDPQPSQLTGNLRCVSDPAEIVIGYFDVLAEQQQRIFIGKEQLPAWAVTTGYEACRNDTVDIESPPRPGEAQIPNGYMFIERRLYIKVFDDMGNIINRPTIGAVISTTNCVDCRTRGTNIKPDFWQ
ncbi:DUF4249 domain-containing protein [Rhodocytophaga aerolata]|uniref:DUF4249 domain-containing protein n=1 Tax=Rhodocytophaga aerolata TaxID=455078 RepID=A0ABT8RGT7_9BACT|nr:DUF4249 domain-containing protein [Rhodocytophaga aerolata]MDO1450368.1 DUF4249 domain-containing protein [Rhodocytophaga aerolata]